MIEVVVRQAGLEDAADAAVLLTELNQTVGALGYDEAHHKLPEHTDLTAAQMTGRMRRASAVETQFIAYADGEPAGFTSLRLIPYLDQDTPYAEITQMHVRPRFRRLGIASRLIGAAEEQAQSAGATAICLITDLDNEGGHAFYRRSGYEAVNLQFAKYFERSTYA